MAKMETMKKVVKSLNEKVKKHDKELSQLLWEILPDDPPEVLQILDEKIQENEELHAALEAAVGALQAAGISPSAC